MPHQEFADRVLRFLVRFRIATLATLSESDGPSACTIFYVLKSPETLYFKSRTASQHSSNVASDSHAALVVADPSSTYAQKSGVQLRGLVRRVTDDMEMETAVALYVEAFPDAAQKFDPVSVMVSAGAESTMYAFDVQDAKYLESSAHMEEYTPIS